jgi:selenium metabolism protein YedF
MDKTLDLRGLICPEPVLRTKKLLDDQSIQKVEAIVESDINVNNLKRLAKSLRMEARSEKKGESFIVTLERIKDDGTKAAGKKDVDIPNNSSETNISHLHAEDGLHASRSDSNEQTVGTVVFIGKDSLGEGDQEFSKTLISLFLQTMYDGGHRPRAILMANTGVRLLSRNSASLKVLQDFRQASVEVLACGLCVEFYKLKDEIPVDQITNMFAICEYMFAADKLIVP